jgi:Family of unknown function (DUF6212)
MLALRLWCGLPGVAQEPTTHPLCARVSAAVGDQAVAQIRLTRDHSAPFVWFAHLEGGRVLLHPLPKVVAAAVIPVRSLSSTIAFSCEIGVEDARFRSLIACKLVAAAPGTGVDQAEREDGVLGSSGWMEFDRPNVRYLLTADLQAPYDGPVELHFFSRIADASAAEYGWLVFSGFVAESYERTNGSMPVTLPESRQAIEQT